jgi:sugar lactone lactonase YvrE
MFAAVVTQENQECTSTLSAAAARIVSEKRAGSKGICRFLTALTARRKRSWTLALTVLLLAATSAWAQGVSSQNTTVTAQASGTVATVEVLTMGSPGLDYADVPGSSNCLGATLAVTQTCTETVTFNPAYPGMRMGAVVLLDSNNNVLGTAYLAWIGVSGLGVLSPGNVVTAAGVFRNWTSTKDGIPATQANLWLPSSITFDGAGNMYIADSNHNRIRMVAAPVPPATVGIITTVAGTGEADYTGDGHAASAATLNSPTGVALDGAGNLYIADNGNNVIRMVNPAGIITTVAGNGTAGYGGDGLAASSPQVELNQPQGVTVGAYGDLYIADTYNQRIRRVDVVTGIITTVAGDGDPSGKGDSKGTYTGDSGLAVNAGLSLPYTVAFDVSGNMYIPDSANNVIRMVAVVSGAITPSSKISTVVGFFPGTAGSSGDNGPATKALLNTPSGVATDAAGNLYIADTQNGRIQKVNAATGIIATLAENTPSTPAEPAGAPPPVQIYAPVGLFLDGSGNLYFADFYYMLIEEIQSNKAVLNFTATSVHAGSESKPQTETVENDGNAPLDLTAITPDANAAVDPGTTTCNLTTALAVDDDCLIGAVFAPSPATVFGSGVTFEVLDGNVDVDGNTPTVPLSTSNFPLDIEVVGVATPVNATTLALTSSPDPSNFGQNVVFTATVTTGAGQGTPTGTVTFTDTFMGAAPVTLGSPVTLNGLGVATYATTTLAVGAHTITATFAPSAGSKYLPSPPSTLVQNVGEVTSTTLISSANPSVLGANVTLTATVTVSGGGSVALDGTVTFTDTTTGTVLGSPAVDATGIIAISTASLAYGQHAITATYSGDATNGILGSTSAILKQDVQTPSTTTISSNLNPSTFGDTVIFTVTVPTVGTVAATGTVNILETGQAAPIGTVTLSGNPGTGTFTTSALLVGTDTITAAYLGDLYYAPSNSPPFNQVVNLTQTTTAVAAVPNPEIAGKPVAITATVTLASGAPMTAGTVTFTDGTTSLGTVTVTAAGTATINPTLAVGVHSIVATYSGDPNGAGSVSAALPLTVAQATTQTSVTATPNPAVTQAAVTFTAKVTGNGGIPTGSVIFNANGTPIGAPATLDATGTATITYSALAAGSYTITAVYGGDTNDQGSTGTGAAQLVVGAIPTVTNLGVSATTGANPQAILVAVVQNNATGSPASLPTPTGTVTFNSINGTTATPIGSSPVGSSGVATLEPSLASGTYQVEAVYGGDALHSSSTSSAVSVSSAGAGYNLVVTPATVTVKTTENITVNVALTSITGFTDTIGLGCASLPAGVNCHFSSLSVSLPANGEQSVTLTIDTNNPLGGGSSAMNARPGSRSISLAGLFLPLSVILGCVFWRFRRRHTALMTAALVLLLGFVAQMATGCSGFSQSSATPGTYVIQVTGTGANSDIAHYQNVTLTITKD